MERNGRRSASVLELHSGLLLFKKTVDYYPEALQTLTTEYYLSSTFSAVCVTREPHELYERTLISLQDSDGKGASLAEGDDSRRGQ
ncbi:MAG: hypothetical protein IJV48_08230 [Ruminococcus sp.]|nr:hypothetical protein [Ruminococcus sp.]